MKFKSAAIFAVLFLFLTVTVFPANSQNIGEYRKKKIAMGEILQENTDVLQFFESLTTREQDLLNSVLQENYLLGYHTEVSHNSKDAASGEHLSKTKERLQALKEGGLYQTILYKAKNATKTHLLRYVVRRYEAGTIHGGAVAASAQPAHSGFFGDNEYWDKLFFGRTYAQVSKESWVPLDPKEVFPVERPAKKRSPVKKSSPTDTAIKEMSDGTGNEEKVIRNINWSAIGKVSLIGALILLVVAAIVALVGAWCCPELPIFKQVREMLEY